MLDFKVDEIDLFPNHIWVSEISNIDNESIAEYVNKIKDHDPKGIGRSNIGGWHSHSYEVLEPLADDLKNLLEESTEFVNDYCAEKTKVSDLMIGNYWFIVNSKYNYNAYHNHQGSFLSAAYYVQAEGDVGQFFIERGDSAEYYFKDRTGKSEFTATNFNIVPKTGNFILFPSWLKHGVGQNLTDKDRIVLSINYVLPLDVTGKRYEEIKVGTNR